MPVSTDISCSPRGQGNMTNSFLNSPSALMEHFVCPTISSLIGTVVGAVLGGYLAYRFGKVLADHQDMKQASAAFKKAFLDELLRLETSEDVDTYRIVSPALPRHQAAIQEFMFRLPPKRQAELNKLWLEYYCDQATSIPFLEQYADCGNLTKRKDMRELAAKRIRNLVEFAAGK